MLAFVQPNFVMRKVSVMESIRKNLKDITSHLQRPSTTFKPILNTLRNENSEISGWKAVYGGLSAVGSTPEEAMINFDKIWVMGV